MTKRQISTNEEAELNTPEFDDEIEDHPVNMLPLTTAPIRRSLPASPKVDSKVSCSEEPSSEVKEADISLGMSSEPSIIYIMFLL